MGNKSNMRELKCPKCGNMFSVDEADYASILSQIRNAEFEAEVQRRMNEVLECHRTEQELATQKSQRTFQIEFNQKDVTNFKNGLEELKKGFYRFASEKFKTAIDEMDKSIDHLQKVRKALVGSEYIFSLEANEVEEIVDKD